MLIVERLGVVGPCHCRLVPALTKESADGFVLLKEVLDPAKGWLENDSLVVELGLPSGLVPESYANPTGWQPVSASVETEVQHDGGRVGSSSQSMTLRPFSKTRLGRHELKPMTLIRSPS